MSARCCAVASLFAASVSFSVWPRLSRGRFRTNDGERDFSALASCKTICTPVTLSPWKISISAARATHSRESFVKFDALGSGARQPSRQPRRERNDCYDSFSLARSPTSALHRRLTSALRWPLLKDRTSDFNGPCNRIRNGTMRRATRAPSGGSPTYTLGSERPVRPRVCARINDDV